MTNFSIFRIINIGLCLLLLADGFLIAPKVKTVVVSHFNSKLTKVKRSSYYNYFIHTSDNYKYEISEGLSDNLKMNDTIRIYSSPIISMPRELHYQQDAQDFSAKIGQLSSKSSLPVGLIISLLISIITCLLQFAKRFKTSQPLNALQAIAFAISFTVFLFVISEVFVI